MSAIELCVFIFFMFYLIYLCHFKLMKKHLVLIGGRFDMNILKCLIFTERTAEERLFFILLLFL